MEVFVGREDELADLERRAAAGRAGVVLTGPPGIGKTRLAVEHLRRAGRSGRRTVRVAGTTAAAQIPLGALATVCTELPPRSPDADLASALGRCARQLTAGEGPLSLLVDDAHLLDPASALLVQQLALTGEAFVLSVVPTDRVVPAPILAALKDGVLDATPLGELAGEDLERLVAAWLGGPVEPGALAELSRRAQGNLTVLRELIGGATAGGALRPTEENLWLLAGPITPSPLLVGLVESELAPLTADERAALEAVAFGEPLGSAEVDAIGGRALLERLEELGLVRGTTSDRRLEVRMSVPVHGDVLRAGLPVIRRQALAQRFADLVEARGARRAGDVLRDATWRLEAGSADHRLLLTAATEARDKHDYGLAEKLARAAAREGGGFAARLLAAQMAEVEGRTEIASAEFAELSSQASTDAERGMLAVSRIAHTMYKIGNFEAGRALAAQELAEIRDPQWRDEITVLLAGIAIRTEGMRPAAETALQLMAGADGRRFATGATFAAASLGRLGRVEEACDVARRGYEAHLLLRDSLDFDPAAHVLHGCAAMTYAGEFAEADELAGGLYREAVAARAHQSQAFLAWAMARPVADRGNIRTAVRYAQEAIAIFRESGRSGWAQGPAVYLAQALALSGRGAEAVETIDGLDASSPLLSSAVDLLLARAWTAVATGDLRLARRHIDDAVAGSVRSGDAVGESVAVHTHARLGNPRAAIDRLTALAEVIEGPLTIARLTHVQALLRRDPEGLEAASAGFATLGADLLAAEAAADAAATWRREMDQRRAAAAERLARISQARCAGALTPSLRQLVSKAHLTVAERDAATLAAAGHSNKDIAAALSLSVRTVENQLHRAYNKLGVSSRDALAEALGQEI